LDLLVARHDQRRHHAARRVAQFGLGPIRERDSLVVRADQLVDLAVQALDAELAQQRDGDQAGDHGREPRCQALPDTHVGEKRHGTALHGEERAAPMGVSGRGEYR
ncbi:hypothetical protein, partial [Salmonella enterica]|uniref:hypothetical protein n=1 Tax=Salmonella enterica TaxID=28901 RepID=UPI000AA72FF2